jgi:hypothetical protein
VTVLGTIEDQQLSLDEYGFGHDGTRAARTGESDDRRHQMQKKDRTMLCLPTERRGTISRGPALPDPARPQLKIGPD